MPDDHWAKQLAGLIRGSILEFSEQVTDQIEMVAVDCHPWNGFLALAALTHAEALRDPALADPAEMAAWEHYDFGSTLASWTPASNLSLQMREEYSEAGNFKAGVAEAYFRACAAAVGSDEVRRSLASRWLSDTFRISVAHPDTGEEYFARL